MATIQTDEVSFQQSFYQQVFPNGLLDITMGRSTDGYTRNLIFEQKQNVTSYGKGKALSQAIIYLARFNRDGIPIPAKICLVSQDEGKCFIYNTEDYISYINDIEAYANLKASDGIPDFKPIGAEEVIEFNLANDFGKKDIRAFVNEVRANVKVEINAHNVYGWATFYYENAKDYKQKPEKKAFFEELREPKGTLKDYIEPWAGQEIEFKYIMDMLNDPMTQKKLGAFYTPSLYAKLGYTLVKDAVEKAMKDPSKTDYVIIDRCAGSGNLEQEFDEELLSHTIVSTYELKEWMVLKDRLGGLVRYIIPPIPKNKDELPELNDEGFLSGANALTRDIIDNPEVRKYIDDPSCAIIMYENPPYAETTGIEFQKKKMGKEASTWKNNFVVQEMKKKVKGVTSNDMTNAFIWSAFEYFLRDKSDSYIVYSPIKYWKTQHLISKKFIEGYALNRKHFHAKTDACVSLILWSNEDDNTTKEIALRAVDIVENDTKEEDSLIAKKCFKKISSVFYEGDRESDKKGTILCDLNGLELENGHNKKISVNPKVNTSKNDGIIGYLSVDSFGLDNPRLHSCFTIGAKYNGHGFYIRRDNFLEKLPIFATSRYPDHCNEWKVMSFTMKTADKAENYLKDVREGKLNDFLFKTMFWTCLSHYPHLRSLRGSDNRLYLNELCFEEGTLASETLKEFIDHKGYQLTTIEENLLKDYKDILTYIKNNTDEYKSEFNYGLYQIDEEINIKIAQGTLPNGKPKMVFKYGDLNNQIVELKKKVKAYYNENLVKTLFEYEFLK